MGTPMAVNLVKAGPSVRGFDLSSASLDTARREGVNVAGSAREAALDAAVVITMLPAGEHVLAVWTELLDVVPVGALFIDCSTIDVGAARAAHELAGSRGFLSVDAPSAT